MDEITKKQSVLGEMVKEAQTADKVTGIVYEKGEVRLYLEGATFPLRGAPTADALWSINIVKKFLIESAKIISLSRFWVSILLIVLLPKKKFFNSLLESFNRISFGVMEPYFDYKHFNQGVLNLCAPARGVGKISELFLVFYGINTEQSHKTAKLLAHVVEFDAFYRFKLLDLMSEADLKNMVANPRKEVQRLLKICYNREEIISGYIRPKLQILHKLAWILSVPSIKKAVSRAVEYAKLDLFKIDEIDEYWMLQRIDYHYFGRSPEENMKILISKGWKTPNTQKI